MKSLLILCLLLATPAAAQQVRFDDVVRNLRNPDPNARMTALKMLGESKYLEAIGPIAPLVNDPIDEIQLEAIGTELSFYMVDDVKSRKRIAFIIETRRDGGRAEAVFNAGPLAVWPRPVPPELMTSLLKAVDDEHPRVRLEAIYAFGSIARRPLPDDAVTQLLTALDHYDPAIRAAAARVIGRLKLPGTGEALITAVNDSQPPVRFAAMRALGDIRDTSAIQALVQQLEHYRTGEGAWSALDALAKIGHASSVPVFTARLVDRDQFARRAAAEGLGRAGDTSQLARLETMAARDESAMVRAAAAFALQKVGPASAEWTARKRDDGAYLFDALGQDKLVQQIADYAIELGPSAAGELVKRLGHADEAVRGNAALLLGAVGTGEHVAALEALAQDRDRDVQRAAVRAIERIKLRGA